MHTAGSWEKDIILDPFSGAGITALVAASLGRHYVGFELNSRYVKSANGRLKNLPGLFYPGK
jgi:site-specific DNA-methyltransferase (adenine-specific)